MSVYVDDMRPSFGRMVMCHMVADLLMMADRIAVQRRLAVQNDREKDS